MGTFKYRLRANSGPFSIEDYRVRARRSVPDAVWSFIDYGADDLQTMHANRRAFSRYSLRSRVLTGNEATDLSVTVAGTPVSLPVLLAPTGGVGMAHWSGEVGVARAAEAAGTVSILSTSSTYSFEEVAEATTRGHFFQLYPWADVSSGRHDLTESLINRARRAGYRAMVVTIDVPTVGNREAERKRGRGTNKMLPDVTPARVLDAATKPRWVAGFLRHKRFSMRNLTESVGAAAAESSISMQYRMTRPELNWDDLAWMRDHWDGPMYVKGILDADDAEQAVGLGADGLVVSNHGGRQLDGAPASLDALPAIVARVGDRADIWLDGGIRRGSDVIKALCLGASAVCVGRPHLYGMAVSGADGARHVIEILREEMLRTMTLMGVAQVSDLGPSWLLPSDTRLP